MGESVGSKPDLEAMARRVIDGNRYMVVSTIDDDGRPWGTPVYFSHGEYRDFYWISSPGSKHSLNIAKRQDVSIVVFDSQVVIGGAEAVYMQGRAEEVAEPTDEECGIAFRPRFEGVKAFRPDELRAPAELRLFRATATQHWVLVRGDDPVWGRGTDSRIAVTLP
jgi:hypothetical protein